MTIALIEELKKELQPERIVEITVWKNEDDEEGLTFHTEVVRLLSNNYLLVPSNKIFDEILPFIKPSTIVGAFFGDCPTPYLFYPRIDSIETIKAKGFWISLPIGMEIEPIKRRAFVRIRVRLNVTIIEKAENSAKDDIEAAAYTVDISGGGIQFSCGKKYEPGTILSLILHYGSGTAPENLKAKVLSSNNNPANRRPEEAFISSCQFIDLPEQAQNRLISECFRVELVGRKHLQ